MGLFSLTPDDRISIFDDFHMIVIEQSYVVIVTYLTNGYKGVGGKVFKYVCLGWLIEDLIWQWDSGLETYLHVGAVGDLD